MTTARDVIAEVLKAYMGADEAKLFAECSINALLSAPDYVRQELAALLNPWRPIDDAARNGDDILCLAFGNSQLVLAYDRHPDYPGHPWLTMDGPRYAEEAVSHYKPLEALPAPPSEDKT
jgi:hypothetical protein